MIRRLSELAKLVNGVLGSKADAEISGAVPVARAGSTDITFATSSQLLDVFLASDAAAVIVPEPLADQAISKPSIVVAEPEVAFVQIAELFRPAVNRPASGISDQAIVCPTAVLADDVVVYPGAVIMDGVTIESGSVIYPGVTVMENCQIGRDVKIFPKATLYEHTLVGDRCIIHAGAVLGAFGFGYKSSTGQHQLSAQLGNVVLGDDVEIGANTSVDRGTYDSTTIGDGTKLDNLVMIGHNCQIGKHNLLCSQVGIAGSSTTGDHTVMGGQVGMGDHIDIGSKVLVSAKSGIMQNVPDGQHVAGIPAHPARETMTMFASQVKLPAMRKEVKRLTKQLAELQATVEALGQGDSTDNNVTERKSAA